MPIALLNTFECLHTPSKTIVFGIIDEDRAKVIGRPAGEIKLQKGTSEWGAMHIDERHSQMLGDCGFPYIEDYVFDVVSNHTQIIEQYEERLMLFMPSFESKIHGVSHRNNYCVIIEFIPDFGFWRVISAYMVRADKKIKGQVVWQRSEPATGPSQTIPS